MSGESVEDKSKAEVRILFTFAKKLNKSVYSPDYFARNLPFCLYVEPDKSGKAMGVYLCCNRDNKCTKWSCLVEFELKVVGADRISKKFEKNFFKINDWGVKDFLADFYNANPENNSVTNDKITVDAHIKAGPVYGIFCEPWDSYSYTGYVGLLKGSAVSNMNATNALLQLLFFITKFRNAIFKLQTWGEAPTTSIAQALQRTLHDLKFSEKSVDGEIFKNSAKQLLSWSNKQDLLNVLLQKLQTRMKDTTLKMVISDLFEGRKISQNKCTYVDVHSTTSETFYKLYLEHIVGSDDINKSLERYLKSKSKSHSFSTSEFGLQPGEIRVVFSLLPKVLFIFLDVKKEGRFEFYKNISLDGFLNKPDPENPASYTLQSVIVEYNGEGVIYIDPKCDNQWHKFQNEIVCKCTEQNAIEDNYDSKERASLFVYIRDNAIPEVLQEGENVARLSKTKNKLMKENEFLRRRNEELVKTNVMLEKSRKHLMEELEVKNLQFAIQEFEIKDPIGEP